MPRYPLNIERSAFRPREWIGYLPTGHAVRILTTSHGPVWYGVVGFACQERPAFPCPKLHARTLRDMGEQLSRVECAP